MIMIDVLVKQANKEIKEGTILKVPDEELFGKKSVFEFEFNEDHFYDEEGLAVEDLYPFDTDFLNSEVELIPPKEKKYLIKINLRWLSSCCKYLSYNEINERVYIQDNINSLYKRVEFTKQELKSIQPVREFLEDMQGKYELVEVVENETN